MILAGLELARRLEAAEAQNGLACVDAQRKLNPDAGTALLEVAGGVAIFVGAQSPLSRAIGLSMRGTVRSDVVEQLEAFYGACGGPVHVDVCPLADITLLELLRSRGYGLTEFNNVLVRRLPGAQILPPPNPPRIGIAGDEHLWAHTVGRGFLEKALLTTEEVDVGRTIFHMAGSVCYLAFRDGQAAAAGAMTMQRGLAILFADSTLPEFRCCGLHGALIRARLSSAAAAGCDLATATTMPGSVSQRNYERYGFQVAYTKAVLTR
jgi:hypothetical protein